MFCAGANIKMLAASPHSWKVNFCKFTNETRNGIEDASAHSGLPLDRRGQRHRGRRRLRAGAGLRRDRAGRRQLLGGLAARGAAARRAARHRRPHPRRRQARRPPRPRRRLLHHLRGHPRRARGAVAAGRRHRQGPRLPRRDRPPRRRGRRDVVPARRRRAGRAAHPAARARSTATPPATSTCAWSSTATPGTATITVLGPTAVPGSVEELHEQGDPAWLLATTRELDDAILRLRTNELSIGTWLLRTEGDVGTVAAYDEFLLAHRDDWLVNETIGFYKRTVKRLDTTSRSLFALIEPGSCFAGLLAEIAFAADRSFMLEGQFEERRRPEAARGDPARRVQHRPAADGQRPHPAAGPLPRQRRRAGRRARPPSAGTSTPPRPSSSAWSPARRTTSTGRTRSAWSSRSARASPPTR